jgi:hypothetical protein
MSLDKNRLLSEAREVRTSEDPNLIGVLLQLSKEISLLSEELERLKPLVREKARNSHPAEAQKGRVSFPTPNSGEVTVTFQKNRVSLSGDPKELKDLLGQEVFGLLFEEKTSYAARREILSLIANLPEPLATKTKVFVKVSEETPRVGFVLLP